MYIYIYIHIYIYITLNVGWKMEGLQKMLGSKIEAVFF